MQALLSALRIEQRPQLMAASPVISPVAAPATLGTGHLTAPSVTFADAPILLSTTAQPTTSSARPPPPPPLDDELRRELHQRQEEERRGALQQRQQEEQEALQAIHEQGESVAAWDLLEQEEFLASAPYALRPLFETGTRPARAPAASTAPPRLGTVAVQEPVTAVHSDMG
eukprot:1830702-Pleurochrysis_carterae.AAC.1